MFPAMGDLFGALDKRFVSTVWLPVQALLGGLLGIVIGAAGWAKFHKSWTALPVTAQVGALF